MNQKNQQFTSKDIGSHIEAMERAAYQQGWDDAIAAIREAAVKVSSPKLGALSQMQDGKPQDGKSSVALIQMAAEFIKNNPGKTRTDVVKQLQSRDASINAETLRTSIRRLVSRNVVEDKEGKLY